MKIPLVLITCCFFLSATGYPQEEVIDHLIAVVNGQAITATALEDERIFQTLGGADEMAKQPLLREIIERKLMLQESRDWGLHLEDWDKRVEQQIQTVASHLPSDASLDDYLQRKGVARNALRDWVREKLMTEELIRRRWLEPIRATMNAEERRQNGAEHLQQHPRDFMRLSYRSALISPADTEGIDTAAIAEEIVSRLRSGITFDELRKRYETNPHVSVHTEPREVRSNTKLGRQIVSLSADEISQPIRLHGNILVVQLLEKQALTYAEVSGEVDRQLLRNRVEKSIREWLERQKEEGNIRILESGLRPMKGSLNPK